MDNLIDKYGYYRHIYVNKFKEPHNWILVYCCMNAVFPRAVWPLQTC